MFRLFRGFVAEGLGLGGLLWAMSLLSGSDGTPTVEANPSAWTSRPTKKSGVTVSLRKPPIFASLDGPTTEPPFFETPRIEAPVLEAERETFFRGTDSLFDAQR